MSKPIDEVLKFLTDCKVFYVTSVEGNKPKVRPFALVFIYEDKLYFSTNDTKPSYAQIKDNPNVEVCTTNEKSEWVRVAGEAVYDDRPEIKEKVFETMPPLKDLYGKPDSPRMTPFYLKNVTAQFCSMTGEPPRIVKF